MRSLETGRSGFGGDGKQMLDHVDIEDLEHGLRVPNSKRFSYIYEALKRDMSIEEIYGLTKIDPWFLTQFKQIVVKERVITERGFQGLDADFLRSFV